MPVPNDVYVLIVLSFLLLIAGLVYNWAVNLPTTKNDLLAPKTFGRFFRTLVITCFLVGLVAVAVFFLFFSV